jgi:hypothetical protein
MTRPEKVEIAINRCIALSSEGSGYITHKKR